MIEQLTDEVRRLRRPEHDVAALLLNRWSPRAMSGESLSDAELLPLFEAARWAPSSFNGQPWRFVYAKRGTQHWDGFLGLLAEPNRIWCKNGAVLVVVCARKTFERNGKPSRTHAFDAGAAWENLAVEGCRRGLVVHGMEGFDYEKARTVAAIGDEYEVLAMIVVGKRGKREELPAQLAEVEQPNGRRPLHEIVFEGTLRSR